MPYFHSGSLRYFSFNTLNQYGVLNAIITRRGGVSPSPWDSLNLGGTVGDDRERVAENRKIVCDALGIGASRLYEVWQVHSNSVAITREPRNPTLPHQKADAILTDQAGVYLLMRFADCVPILLYDPIKKICGLVHAGWKGTILRVVEQAIQKMGVLFDVLPENIFAGIGPSIGPDHYVIGRDVAMQIRSAFGNESDRFLLSHNRSIHFNLWGCNQWIMEQNGVKHIENPKICTACHLEDWYSHRAEHGNTGRFGVVIGMRE
jgi:YfiH family protein